MENGSGGRFSDESLLSEDEHNLIASYSATLGSSVPQSPVLSLTPKSPHQIISAIDGMQKEEMEAIVRNLEEENRQLQSEYERLKSLHGTGAGGSLAGSSPQMMGGTLGYHHSNGAGVSNGAAFSMDRLSSTLPRSPQTRPGPLPPYAHPGYQADYNASCGLTEEEMLAEARALRKHKSRLEARSHVLEEHNRQLEAQLIRLKQIIDEAAVMDDSTTGPIGNGHSMSSETPSLQQTFALAFQNGHARHPPSPYISGPDRTTARLNDLRSMAQDVGRAMESWVGAVTSEDDDED